jgi:hypothetical protein
MRKRFKFQSPPLLKGDFEDVHKILPNPPLEKEGIKISLFLTNSLRENDVKEMFLKN